MIKIAEPFYLYLLVLVPVFIIIYVYAKIKRKKLLAKIGNIQLLNQLTQGYSKTRSFIKFFLMLSAFIFVVIVLIRVQLGTKIEKAQRKGIDIYIALDISNSMLAEDILPNRLQRSKQAISKLIDKLEGDRIGIIIFAGKSFVQLPLTNDYSAAKMFLETISVNDIPEQGTAIGSAIDKAMESFEISENNEKDNKRNKAIIIITDGENHEDDALEKTADAVNKGIFVYTIGMGLPEGAPIPVAGGIGGYKKDKEGNTIITRLDETLLQKIAVTGKGAYVRANNSNAGLQTIYDEINKIEKKEYESRSFSDYEDKFQFFAALALLFLLVEFIIKHRKNNLLSKIKLFESSSNKIQ